MDLHPTPLAGRAAAGQRWGTSPHFHIRVVFFHIFGKRINLSPFHTMQLTSKVSVIQGGEGGGRVSCCRQKSCCPNKTQTVLSGTRSYNNSTSVQGGGRGGGGGVGPGGGGGWGGGAGGVGGGGAR
jgi:Predicted membrane protein